MRDSPGHTPSEPTDPPGEPLEEIFTRLRPRLRLALALRLDRRVQRRIDPSDVLQDVFLEAAQRYDKDRQQEHWSPYLWLRFLALQKLLNLHRFHLEAQGRDARRECGQAEELEVSSLSLAELLIDSASSLGRKLIQAERADQLRQALDRVEPIDREILVLRHFEQLRNEEIAQILGLTPSAASHRYLTALRRMKELLTLIGVQREST